MGQTVTVTIGDDGKLYPPHRLGRAGRSRIRLAEHRLHCERGLSVRAVQAALAQTGTRRSLGAISQDLTR